MQSHRNTTQYTVCASEGYKFESNCNVVKDPFSDITVLKFESYVCLFMNNNKTKILDTDSEGLTSP